MSYPEWRESLFEDTFPKMKFDGGTISWNHDETLSIEWDGKKYRLDPESLYCPDEDPVDSVLSWAWQNLPLASWEHADAEIWWSDTERRFRASSVRSPECVYSQTVVPDQSFTRFGHSPDSNRFQWRLEGGLLAIHSLTPGIPGLCPLSHPITLDEVMSGFFETEDDILVVTPVHDPQYAFIGHRNVVSRISQEDRGVLGVPVTRWKHDITKALEGR